MNWKEEVQELEKQVEDERAKILKSSIKIIRLNNNPNDILEKFAHSVSGQLAAENKPEDEIAKKKFFLSRRDSNYNVHKATRLDTSFLT